MILYYPCFCKYLVGRWRVVTTYVLKSTVNQIYQIYLKTIIVDRDGLFFI